jgi:hypothetical protein
MRSSHRLAAAIAAFLLCVSFAAHSAYASGSYTQNFSSTPTGWQSFDETFVATGGYYATTTPDPNQPRRAIAVYNNNTWGTNYTYSVKLYSDYESDGNRVGIIFNFVDVENYYEMSISMRKTATSDPNSGHALLSRVQGGVSTPIGSEFHPAATQAWPVKDQFFTVTVTRNGTNTVIQVGGLTVFNVPNLATTAGHIGFFSQFNNGRFDDVSVADTTLSYLFRSGFESPVVLTTPECRSGTWFVNLNGADSMGFSWPPSFWGTSADVFNTSALCDYPMSHYVDIDLPTRTGPTGANSRVLMNNVHIWHPGGDTSISPRAGVTYTMPGNAGQDHVYIRRWLKYPANFMTDRMGVNSWFVQHEYKTGCSATIPGRIMIRWERNAGVAKYHLLRDDDINCGPANPAIDLANCIPGSSGCPAMPQGSWFYDEVFMSYPSSGNGVVQYAINGATVFNYSSAGTGNTIPTLPNRLKLTPGYMNATEVEVLVDDLEVLPNLPCATFPCGPPSHVN